MTLRCDLGEVITAMVTPFDKERAVDFQALEDVVGHLIEQKSDAIVVSGTTGESPTLTHEEEYEMLLCVKSAAGYTGLESRRETVMGMKAGILSLLFLFQSLSHV